MFLKYRPHTIANVEGGNNREAILNRLESLAKELKAGDRLLVYLTGHGGKGKVPADGQFWAWNRERITTREFTSVLDKFDPKVSVMVVMVHCYAGAYADILFKQGDRDKGLAPHRRVGFFATVDTRPAAGCTPDTKVSDYHEYSTAFWAAMSGKDRLGETVLAQDLDSDGRIAPTEAHAHALIHSPTIDISMKTSDRFLRAFSRLDTNNSRLFLHDRDFSRLLAVAALPERHVLELLSKELKLGGENRIADAMGQAERIEIDRKGKQEEIRKLQGRIHPLREKISKSLQARWPFLSSGWHPETQRMLRENGRELVRAVKGHSDYAEWSSLRQKIAELKQADLAKEREWAMHQRLVATAESVALAKNLELKGDAEIRKRYAELVALEQSFFNSPPATVVSQK